MEKLSLYEVLKALDGELLNGNITELTNLYINGVSTDSRKIEAGNLFVPIKGEHFDGHKFIVDCCNKGAFCLTQTKEADIIKNQMVIYVSNTIKALGDLAKYYRNKFKSLKIIGLTGSVGKTTSKDMIASVFIQSFNILKTDGNYNNEIGLPLTLFNLTSNTEIAILELGMSHFGEIEYLTKIIEPIDGAAITNIGVSHMENLGSREGILKAKSEIFEGLNKDSIAVLNSDDDMLITLKNNLKSTIIWFGIENKLNIYADNINLLGLNGVSCDIHIDDKVFNVYIRSPGKHIIYAALLATALATHFNIPIYKIKQGIEQFEPTQMRMNISKVNSFTLINDAYNASPQSMKAALEVLKNSGGNRKVAILGDMLEIGNETFEIHNQVGCMAANLGIDLIICIGELGKYIYDGAKSNKSENQIILYFENQDYLYLELKDLLKKDDTILVKASRGLHLEKTIDKIEKVELQ